MEAVPFINQILVAIEENASTIQVICGSNTTQELMEIAQTANVQLCGVSQVLKDIRLYFQCQNWFPLYETTLYETMCYNGTYRQHCIA